MIYAPNNDTTSFIGSSHELLLDVVNSPATIGGSFTVNQNSSLLRVSRISFNAQLNLNGYLLVCTDILRFNEAQFTINVSGIA